MTDLEYGKPTVTTNKNWFTVGGRKYFYYCTYCERELQAGSTMFPNHEASKNCESGNKNHCSCDRCF